MIIHIFSGFSIVRKSPAKNKAFASYALANVGVTGRLGPGDAFVTENLRAAGFMGFWALGELSRGRRLASVRQIGKECLA